MATIPLLYLNQYFTTSLNVGGGIDDTQTTGIIVSDVSGVDTAKPGVAILSYSDPLNTTLCEWVIYTSINGSKELQGVTRGAEGYSAKSHANSVSVAFPLSESHVNRINDMFNSVGLDVAQIATPANPDSGRNKIYPKSDGYLYKLTSGGTETVVDPGFIVPTTISTNDGGGTLTTSGTTELDVITKTITNPGIAGRIHITANFGMNSASVANDYFTYRLYFAGNVINTKTQTVYTTSGGGRHTVSLTAATSVAASGSQIIKMSVQRGSGTGTIAAQNGECNLTWFIAPGASSTA